MAVKYLTTGEKDMIKYMLAGKVTFGTDPYKTISNEMFDTIISQSESQVETMLQFRYRTFPSFMNKSGGDFFTLPSQTQNFIVKLIQVYTMIFILAMDFGRNNGTLGKEFLANMKSEFSNTIKSQMEKDPTGRFVRPSLPELELSGAYNDEMALFAPQPIGGEGSSTPYTLGQTPMGQFNWLTGSTLL